VKVYLAGVLSAGLYPLSEAAALLDQAVALAAREPSIPRDQLPAAWSHQGEIMLESGHFDRAEALFHQAIAADSNTSDAWIGLARSSFLKHSTGTIWPIPRKRPWNGRATGLNPVKRRRP